MKMDRVDKIITMISDVVANAYNCGEPLFTNHTTSLSVEKEDVLKKVEQNISNPMSFRGFIKRMQTYNIVCWHAYRTLALQLARRGWENVKDYLVRCCFCAVEMDLGAHVSSSQEELLRLLSKHHAPFCRWLTTTSPEFFACMPYVQSSQGLKNTVTRTASLLLESGQELPKIPEIVLHKMKLERETLELLICGLLKDAPVSDTSISAVVLTLCGWSPASTKGILCCCYCDRRIALRHWMSVQEFEEQRRLVLSDNNNMKICSASYLQSSFADGTEEDEDGSQSPISEQSISTDCSDEEEELEEEEDEEMETEEYEVYGKETEEQDCATGEDDDMYDDEQSSKTKNGASENKESSCDKFQSHDDDQVVEMEEHYDELNEQELCESTFNEDDDVDEDTEDEMPPNEDGPSDEDAQEVETSEGSVMSDSVEFKNGNTKMFKGAHKHPQYHSNGNKQKEEYSNVNESQYDSCANEEDIESSEDDELLENEGEEEEVEEEDEPDEGEEVGDEEDEDDEEDDGDDEDDDDDDDDDDEDDDEEEEEDNEMPEDCKFQDNDSDKVIELSDSDEEIESQPKEKIQSVPSPTPKILPEVVIETQAVMKTDGDPNEIRQSDCEKLGTEPETEVQIEIAAESVHEDVQLQKQCLVDARPTSDCDNQEEKTKPLVDEKSSENNTVEEEIQGGSNTSAQLEKCTLKRKRDDDGECETAEVHLSTKRKQILPDDSCSESQINRKGKIRGVGDSEDDKSNMDVEESPCNEDINKNVDTLRNTEHGNDDGDCGTPTAHESSVLEQTKRCEDNHPESSELNDTSNLPENKCEIGMSNCEGSASVVAGSLEQAEVENNKRGILSPVATQARASETPADTLGEGVSLPVVPKSEIGSDAAASEREVDSSGDAALAAQNRFASTGELVGNDTVNMPEVRSEGAGAVVQEPARSSEDDSGKVPTLAAEPDSSDARQPKSVDGDGGREPPLVSGAAQVVADSGNTTQAPAFGEGRKSSRLEESRPPSVELSGEARVAAGAVQNTAEDVTKEGATANSNKDGSPAEATSIQNEKNGEGEPLPQTGEDTGNGNKAEEQPAVLTTSSKIENASEVGACESKSFVESVCPKNSKTDECSASNNEKRASDESDGNLNTAEATEVGGSEALNSHAEHDDGAGHEAMEVCETGEQIAGRGVKRGQDSDSEQSAPTAKRFRPSTAEVRKQPSLLDPTSEHRFWCLWASSRGTATYEHKSGCEIVFQEILGKIVQQRQEQDHMDIAGKLHSTQELIIPL